MVKLNYIQNKIIDAIKNSGLTQTALAEKLKISQPTIACYLSGKALPALDTLANLCEVLDLDANDILCIHEYAEHKINNNRDIKDSSNASYEFSYQHKDTRLTHKERK